MEKETELPSVPQAGLKIPDDLKLLYAMVQVETGSTLAPVTKEGVKALIERIAKSEAREAELNVEVASLTYRNEIAVSAASEWSKRNSVLRQQNRGKNEKLVALQAELASLTQRLTASESREAELKAEITMWRNRYEIMLHQRDKLQDAILLQEPRMEALERSHKALLEIVLHGSQNLSRTLEVIEAAGKL